MRSTITLRRTTALLHVYDDLGAMVAAGMLHRGWLAMTRAERSAKARKQLRDRFGRFVEMGGDLAWEMPDGTKGGGTFEGVSPNGSVIVRDRGSKKLRFLPVDAVRSIKARARVERAEKWGEHDQNARPWADTEDVLDLNDPNFVRYVVARLDRQGVTDDDFENIPPPRGADFSALGYQPKEYDPNNPDHVARFNEQVEIAYGDYLDALQVNNIAPGDPREMSKEEFAEALALQIYDRYASEVKVRVPRKALASVLRSGGVMSQFEVGKSNGLFNPEYRAEEELRTLGVPLELDDRNRPIYGYVDDPHESSSWYGDMIVYPHPEVRERTTATGEDSLDYSSLHGQRLSELEDATIESLVTSAPSTLLANLAAVMAWRTANPRSKETPPVGGRVGYSEAQIHGGLPVEDIKAIDIEDYFSTKIVPIDRSAIDRFFIGGYDGYLKSELERQGMDPQWLRRLPPEVLAEAVAAMQGGASQEEGVGLAMRALVKHADQPLDLLNGYLSRMGFTPEVLAQIPGSGDVLADAVSGISGIGDLRGAVAAALSGLAANLGHEGIEFRITPQK